NWFFKAFNRHISSISHTLQTSLYRFVFFYFKLLLLFHILSTLSGSYCLSFLLRTPLTQKPPWIVLGSYAIIKAFSSICLIVSISFNSKRLGVKICKINLAPSRPYAVLCVTP